MDSKTQEQREIKFTSYAIYICDGYKRVGFISRWDGVELDTSLDARDWYQFKNEEVWGAHKILNFLGITHSILAMTDIT